MVNQSFLTAGCNIHLLIVRFHMQHNLTAVREMLTKLNLLFISLDTTPNFFFSFFFYRNMSYLSAWPLLICCIVSFNTEVLRMEKVHVWMLKEWQRPCHCLSPTAEPLLFHLSFVSSPFSSF